MLQARLHRAMHDAITAIGCTDEVPFGLDFPKDRELGDFASNAAMLLAKALKKPPLLIAESLAEQLRAKLGLFEWVSVAKPGFINMRVNQQLLGDVLVDVLTQGTHFGCAPAISKSRVLVEYISANPTGPLHLGHARAAFVGDALVRLLRAAGHDVTAEFYVNDTGNQIRTLGRSIYLRYKELFGESVVFDPNGYPGDYVIDIAKTLRQEDGDKWLAASEAECLPRCIEVGIRENLKNIRETLALVGIEFDSWYLESSLYERALPQKLIEDYRHLNMLYEAKQALGTDKKVRREESKAAQYAHQQQGGTFLKTSQFGDEEDRIIMRASGEPVYLLADLAYHREKHARAFDTIVDIFGADHAGHIPRVKAGMQALGLQDKMRFLVVQMVRLLKGGQELRFSKRTGAIYLLSELVEEVGADVARFVFLMRAPNSQFEFNLEIALEQSQENPVFYVQYGHARMATILARAASLGVPLPKLSDPLSSYASHLTLPEERHMILRMDAFPHIIAQAAEDFEPHRVLYFCQELIADFHAYFTQYRHTEKVISEDANKTQARLAFVAALKQTLFNGLSMLGISAPDTMTNELE